MAENTSVSIIPKFKTIQLNKRWQHNIIIYSTNRYTKQDLLKITFNSIIKLLIMLLKITSVNNQYGTNILCIPSHVTRNTALS